MGKKKVKLAVLGIGPGDKGKLTTEAMSRLKKADVIVGYRSYIKKVRVILPDKDYREYKMGKEIDRVRDAIALAQSGLNTVLISSGDAGIYGMAGPVIENAPDSLQVEVVPGLSSLSFCGALLGAPLMNDFVVISLSDLLTPRSVVLRRLTSALEGGFVLVVYNPTSSKRAPLFNAALKKIKEARLAGTVCGVVRQDKAGLFHATVTQLSDIEKVKIDMSTTLFIGNEHTTVVNGKMVTKRGYERKK